MRALALNEINNVAGGYIGESVIYDFDLKPGVEVVGFERITVDYDYVEILERGIFKDTVTIIETPIYAYYPIYDRTITFIA